MSLIFDAEAVTLSPPFFCAQKRGGCPIFAPYCSQKHHPGGTVCPGAERRKGRSSWSAGTLADQACKRISFCMNRMMTDEERHNIYLTSRAGECKPQEVFLMDPERKRPRGNGKRSSRFGWICGRCSERRVYRQSHEFFLFASTETERSTTHRTAGMPNTSYGEAFLKIKAPISAPKTKDPMTK